MAPIPTTFKLAYAGAIAVPLLVIAAVSFRAPVFADDAGPDAASSASATAESPSSAPSASTRVVRPTSAPLASSLVPLIMPVSAAVASAARPVVPGGDYRPGLDELRKDLNANNLTAALATLHGLVAIDPDVVAHAHAEIIDLTQRIMLVKGKEPSDMFDMLVNQLGTAGLDVLYEMVTTKGGSDAAVASKELLDRADVIALASPAMRVAYQLRNASLTGTCEQVRALFSDVREHGDGRSLGQLYLLGKHCGRHHVGTCCLENDPDLDATVKALQAKGYQ